MSRRFLRHRVVLLDGKPPKRTVTELAEAGGFDVLAIQVPREPPSEFRIFAKGPNPSTKGTFTFDAISAKSVMAKYAEMGRRVTFDYDHASLKPSLDPALASRSAGDCDLQLRDEELWAVDIKWTPNAATAISNGEWPYFSPAFERDEKGRPTWLINIALTANPALHDLERLIAAHVARLDVMVAGATPYRGFPVVNTASWDADAAEHRVRKWASSDGSGDTSTIDWDKYGLAFAWHSAEPKALGDFKLCHHDVQHGELVTIVKGVYAAAAAMQGARGQTPDIPDADVAKVREHLASHYHQMKRKAPWEQGADENEETTSATDEDAVPPTSRSPGTAKDQNMSLSKYSDLNDFMKTNKLSKAKMARALGLESADFDKKMASDNPFSKDEKDALKSLQAELDDAGPPSSESAAKTAIKAATEAGIKAGVKAATKAATKAKDDDDEDDDEEEEDMKAKAAVLTGLSVALGMSVSAGSDALIGRVGKLCAAEKELLSATGKNTIAGALGVVEAWKLDAEAGKTAREELANFKKAQGDKEITLAIDKAIVDGKIAPKAREGIEAKAKAHGAEWLTSMIDMLPVDPALKGGSVTPADKTKVAEHLNAHGAPSNATQTPGERPNTQVSLSAEDRKVIALLGLTEEDYVKAKQLDIAERARIKQMVEG